MANDPRGQVIRRLAVMLRLIHPDDEARHRESQTVLAEAHKEIDASRKARLAEMTMRLDVRARR